MNLARLVESRETDLELYGYCLDIAFPNSTREMMEALVTILQAKLAGKTTLAWEACEQMMAEAMAAEAEEGEEGGTAEDLYDQDNVEAAKKVWGAADTMDVSDW